MIEQLVPASANMSSEVRNVVESHVLERNKYWSKYPMVEQKKDDPIIGARGINELLYDWENAHAPLSNDVNENCFWQNQRSERTTPTVVSASRGCIRE